MSTPSMQFTEVHVAWVPYPERFSDVLASVSKNFDESPLVYWEHNGYSIIEPLDFPQDGVYYVKDHQMPYDIGQGAWRKIDFDHPRCVWGCGRFVRKSDPIKGWPKKQRFVCWACADDDPISY